MNVKAAFEGETWQWHYDFATHHRDDGVPQPLALNLHVFLDEVNEFNGPLYFIPGSHKHGPADVFHDISSTSYPLWVVHEETVSKLVADTGIVSATGPAGQYVSLGSQYLFTHLESEHQRTDKILTTRIQASYRFHNGYSSVGRLSLGCVSIEKWLDLYVEIDK